MDFLDERLHQKVNRIVILKLVHQLNTIFETIFFEGVIPFDTLFDLFGQPPSALGE